MESDDLASLSGVPARFVWLPMRWAAMCKTDGPTHCQVQGNNGPLPPQVRLPAMKQMEGKCGTAWVTWFCGGPSHPQEQAS